MIRCINAIKVILLGEKDSLYPQSIRAIYISRTTVQSFLTHLDSELVSIHSKGHYNTDVKLHFPGQNDFGNDSQRIELNEED